MLLLLAVAMDKVVAQGSTLNGYTLQTAVDSTLWLTPDSVTTIDWANCGNSVNVNIGFDFQYFGEIERDLFVDRFGCVSFGNVCSRNALTQSPFSNIYVMRMGRIIIPFGRWFSWKDSSLMEYGWNLHRYNGHHILWHDWADVGVDYDLKVFTKWGDCIFHTKDINEGWDGTYRGVMSPQSAYVYLCHYKNLSGEPCKVYGTVTLVR